jgi:hypothetical protein
MGKRNDHFIIILDTDKVFNADTQNMDIEIAENG